MLFHHVSCYTASRRVHYIFTLLCPISLSTAILHVGQFTLPRAREIARRCYQIQATASYSVIPLSTAPLRGS